MFFDPVNLKIFINSIILLFVLISTIVLIWRLNFDYKGYKYLFITYILFWVPIMLVRPYRGTMQSEIDDIIKWIPLMLYGFVGIFARPLMDFFGLYFKNRKIVIQSSIIIILFTYIPIIFLQNTATNIIQTIGIGVGASIIGTYELFFKEQYGKSKTFITVSILAIPPLVADFITSPIQSIITSYSKISNGYDTSKLSIMWIIGVAILLIVFFMSFFLKENQRFIGMNFGNKILKKKKDKINFGFICLIGSIILFIKFGNSGSVGTTQLQELSKYTNTDVTSYEGYLSTIFSVFQLLGTFVFGTLAYKGVANTKVFLIGFFIWLFYHFISLFFFNPIFFMVIHSLNGFAYGILYNLLLGYVLSLSFKGKYLTPMGVYQSILAIGISVSNFFTTFISTNIKKIDFKDATFIIDTSIICLLLSMLLLFFFVENRNKKDTFKNNI